MRAIKAAETFKYLIGNSKTTTKQERIDKSVDNSKPESNFWDAFSQRSKT